MPTVPIISPGNLEEPTQMTSCIKLPDLSSLLQSEIVLRLSLSFMTLKLWKIPGQLFSQISMKFKTLMETRKQVTSSMTAFLFSSSSFQNKQTNTYIYICTIILDKNIEILSQLSNKTGRKLTGRCRIKIHICTMALWN